jgi:hypothetical protein
VYPRLKGEDIINPEASKEIHVAVGAEQQPRLKDQHLD